MEKTISFNQNESMQARQIDQDRTQALAQVGALLLDLEIAKKNLESLNDRRNLFVRQVISNNGINQFESARPTKDGVIVVLPEAQQMALRPNGGGDGMVIEK